MSKAPAADYALQIIEFFARCGHEIGLVDINNALGINKNAASRILEALVEQNWIYLSNPAGKKYQLTLRPFSMLSQNIEEQPLVAVARPHLNTLHEALGDCLYLGVRSGKNVVYLLHYDSTKAVRISARIGGEYPLNCAAAGKILLAYSKDQAAYFSESVELRTPNTITTLREFEAESAKIKEQGFAVDNEEFAKGILCVAVPIFDCGGSVVASLGCSTLTIYDDLESLLREKYPLLKETAAQISASLGYRA